MSEYHYVTCPVCDTGFYVQPDFSAERAADSAAILAALEKQLKGIREPAYARGIRKAIDIVKDLSK